MRPPHSDFQNNFKKSELYLKAFPLTDTVCLRFPILYI